MKTTLIICAKNEEKTIGKVIDESKKFVYEIIAIDGHSTDKTKKVIKNKKVIYLLDRGKGKGDAIRQAAKKASGEILVFIDADGSHAVCDIPKLVNPILLNKADLVIASRILGGSDEKGSSLEQIIRSIGSYIITSIINLRFQVRLTDSQNGFRAIKKSVFDRLNLKEDIFTIEQEMVIKALKNKYLIVEIPSHEKARKFDKSKIKLSTMSWRYLWSLLSNII